MLLRRLLLSGAIVAYALVFGEVFLRLFVPQPLVPRFVTGAADGVRANMANVAFLQSTPEVDVTVRYNDAGMRDDRPAPPRTKPPGECRIALVGDSYFVGFESSFANSFGKRLEDQLRTGGRNARVLNFAVSGFGTAEMLVAIRSRVTAYQPDLIVMSWHATDPVDNVRSNLFRLDDGRLTSTGAAFLPGVAASDRLMRLPGYRWLIENSHAYSAVRERIAVQVKALLAAVRGRSLGGDEESAEVAEVRPVSVDYRRSPPRPGSIDLDRALLNASRDAAARAGARFLLFEVPTSGSRTRLMPVLLPQLGLLGDIHTASPLADFVAIAAPSVQLYLEQGHRHWTPLGNRVAARAAARAIAAQGLLANCGRFPDAEIRFEQLALLPKSLIALRGRPRAALIAETFGPLPN